MDNDYVRELTPSEAQDSDRPLVTDTDAPEDHNLTEYGDRPGPDGATDDELVSKQSLPDSQA